MDYNFDIVLRLPQSRRVADPKTKEKPQVCEACGGSITDPFLVVGFKPGQANRHFHEKCAKEKGII